MKAPQYRDVLTYLVTYLKLLVGARVVRWSAPPRRAHLAGDNCLPQYPGRRQLLMSDDEEEDYEDAGYEDEEDEEDYYEDVQLIPGAGQAEVDDETADFSARVERLAAWEEQLVAYNGKLAEEGWKSWKKGAVASVMNELQRKVVPDVWRDEVREANERVRAMGAQLKEVRERERVLTERIDLLENGPGCARELKEQLEIAEVQLNQEQVRA